MSLLLLLHSNGVSSLASKSITISAPSGYAVHNVTDISQAGSVTCLYYGLSPTVAVGDQFLFDNSSGVAIGSTGIPSIGGFDFYHFDDSSETWSAVQHFTDYGVLTKTLGAATLSATGSIAVAGAASVALGAVTISAAGSIGIAGASTVTLGGATLSADGSVTGALASKSITISAPSGYAIHNVSDISQAGSTTCLYYGLSPTVAVGDQFLFANGNGVTIDSQGIYSVGGFGFYHFDDSSESWGSIQYLTDFGALSKTLGGVTLSADGSSANTGTLSKTLGAVTITAAGSIGASGTLSQSLGAISITADGTLGLITLASKAITVSPPAGYAVHNVTDISQASDQGTLYYGQSPAVAVGDQILFQSTTTTYGWSVSVDTQGFVTVSSSGDERSDSFGYYAYDATDETWGTAGTWTIAAPWKLNVTLGAVTLSAAATHPVTGSLSQSLGGITLSATGSVAVVGALTQSVSVSLSAAGSVPVVGALSKTLGAVSISATGVLPIIGRIDSSLGAITLSAAASNGVVGTLSKTIGAVTVTASGSVGVAGALSKTLGGVTLTAGGTNAVGTRTGDLSVSLGAVSITASGSVGRVADASVSLGAVTVSADATIGNAGALSQSIGGITLSATGRAEVLGVLNRDLGEVTLSAGATTGSWDLNKTLGAVTLSASGSLTVGGSATITLGLLTLVADNGDLQPRPGYRENTAPSRSSQMIGRGMAQTMKAGKVRRMAS